MLSPLCSPILPNKWNDNPFLCLRWRSLTVVPRPDRNSWIQVILHPRPETTSIEGICRCAHISFLPFRKHTVGDGVTSQRLQALAALLEVLSSILSTHMAAYNHLWDPVCPLLIRRCTCQEHIHIHKSVNLKKKKSTLSLHWHLSSFPYYLGLTLSSHLHDESVTQKNKHLHLFRVMFLFRVLESPTYKAHASRTTDRHHTEGNSRAVLGRNDAELCVHKWRAVQRMLHPTARALCFSDAGTSVALIRKPSNSGKTMSQKHREN